MRRSKRDERMRTYWQWILLGVSALIVALTTIQAVVQYTGRDTIRGVSNNTYIETIASVLSPDNANFVQNAITIDRAITLSDSLSLVKVTGKSTGLSTYVVFELKDNRLYLTNYGPSPSIGDFDTNSATTNLIIDTVNKL